MSLCKKITNCVAKLAEILCMMMIAALVLAIVIELVRRNFFEQSFGGNVQLCGIFFLWMAFLGLIPLYNQDGLMSLDFLVHRAGGKLAQLLYFLNKGFSLLLGVVMVVAFFSQLGYVGSRYYPTFPIPVPYTVQYVPMAIAGAFIAIKSVEQMAERIFMLKHNRQGGSGIW